MSSKHVVKLSDADRERMSRLFQQVQSQLKEMGDIGARSLSAADPQFAKIMKEGKPVPHFAPKRPAAGRVAEVLEFKGTEITCFGSGEGMCLCYDHDEGTCSVC